MDKNRHTLSKEGAGINNAMSILTRSLSHQSSTLAKGANVHDGTTKQIQSYEEHYSYYRLIVEPDNPSQKFLTPGGSF